MLELENGIMSFNLPLKLFSGYSIWDTLIFIVVALAPFLLPIYRYLKQIYERNISLQIVVHVVFAGTGLVGTILGFIIASNLSQQMIMRHLTLAELWQYTPINFLIIAGMILLLTMAAPKSSYNFMVDIKELWHEKTNQKIQTILPSFY